VFVVGTDVNQQSSRMHHLNIICFSVSRRAGK